MQIVPVQIDTPVFKVPEMDFDVLVTITDGVKSTSCKGMQTKVDVPAGGVEIQFLTGGGKHACPPFFVTTTWEQPKPLPPRPAPRVKTPVVKSTDGPVLNIPIEGERGADQQQSNDVQPVVETPSSDGQPVSGTLQLEVPPVGSGDLGLESGVQRDAEVSPSGTDGSRDQ